MGPAAEPGGSPLSIAAGDLNGDRKPDLVTGNQEDGTVSVFVNNGDGSLQPRLDYRTGIEPLSIAIDDLNGDRRSDLATANARANTVSVLPNTPGLCVVQDVKGKALPATKRTIARAHCRVGKIRRTYSKGVKAPITRDDLARDFADARRRREDDDAA